MKEGQPMLPDLERAGQLKAFGNSSCWYTAHTCSLGMTLVKANTLTFGLIGKTDQIELYNFAV
jgi:hypothetical protein